MSTVWIRYSGLEDAVSYSGKVLKKIDEYRGSLSTFPSTLSRMSGSDEAGYMQSASNLAIQKMNSLDNTRARFSNFEKSLNQVIEIARTADSNVARRIETIAESYIPKRSWIDRAGDWIYDTFCVDGANRFPLIRDFSDLVKRGIIKISKVTKKIHNWFKYGDGKYIWKIGKAVVASVVAVAGAIAAVCAIPFTSGATIPIAIALVGAVASAIGGAITIVNSAATIYSNGKALSLSGNIFDDDDGEPGAARYYGSSETLSDVWKKTDLGDQKTNDGYKMTGKVIDGVKTTADTTAFICNIASLGNVKDYRVTTKNNNINSRYNGDKWYKGYSFTPDNIKRNIAHDMGYYASKTKELKNGKVKPVLKSGSFKLNLVEKSKQAKYTLTTNNGVYKLSEKTVKFFNSVKTVDNSISLAENVDKLYEYGNSSNKSASSTIKAIGNLTGTFKTSKWLSTPDKYITKTIKTVKSNIKLVQTINGNNMKASMASGGGGGGYQRF